MPSQEDITGLALSEPSRNLTMSLLNNFENTVNDNPGVYSPIDIINALAVFHFFAVKAVDSYVVNVLMDSEEIPAEKQN